MSRSKLTCGMAFAMLAGWCSSTAMSQTQTGQDYSGKNQYGQNNSPVRMRIQKGSDLIGKPVKNPQGERLGEVQDLAIDPDSGQIAYAVLSFGGFLGMGEKWFAIPATALTLPDKAEHYVLSVDKDRLKTASGFDKSNWPNMGDPTWGTQIHDFYSQRPYWSETNGTPDRPLRIQKASDLIGKDVNNTQGQDVGEIHDLAIDPDRERVAYVVLSFGGVMNVGDKLFAIPFSSFNLPTDSRSLVLAVDKEQLKASDGFDKQHWPDMANVQWATGTYQHYGQKPFWQDGCPGCGMDKAAYSGNGAGYETGGTKFCCQGCSAGTGCTCVAMTRSSR